MAMTGKKKKIGLADALILLLIIAVIGAAVIFYFSGHTFGSGDAVQITYEVRVTKVRSELTSHVNYGDKVWDSVYGEYIGVVEKVRTEQYTEQVVDRATGELKNAVVGGYYNMYITVNATAEVKDGIYYLAESPVRVGEPVFLRLADFCGEGYCTSLITQKGGEQ